MFRRGPEMTQTVLHFVFTLSGAGCLVRALRKAGRDDKVIASFDLMSFGPIDPSDPASRRKWLEMNSAGSTEKTPLRQNAIGTSRVSLTIERSPG